MIILGIDTSFDDTAVAICDDTTILSNVLSTDLALHLEYGGIVPRLARKSHEDNIDAVIALALKRAHLRWDAIDRIAVTQGPGLSICLEVGIAKAKELATQYDKPLVAINHLEGHLLSFLAERKKNPKSNFQTPKKHIEYPLFGVIISGGNTQFVHAKGPGQYEIVGKSLDDAMGEAFDKIGRMLGLGYPAGPFLEKVAREGNPGAVKFPIPMHQVRSSDLSFSGLKTAASRIVAQYPTLTRQNIADIALGFQTAAIKHLTEKLEFALVEASRELPVKRIVVGGGVIKNLEVRKALRAFGRLHGLPVSFPYSAKLCTDNAAMIAITALSHEPTGLDFDRDPNLTLMEK